jgi:mannose-6-phosphate isomerase-like protein (cupin superfamily)
MGDYEITLDEKFGQSHAFDIAAEARLHEPWFNETLTHVNDALVRLGVVEGEFHWHKHDDEDEFFLVLDGELRIEIDGSEPVTLAPHQGITIPRGVRHKPSASARTTILMVEPAGVVPTGS